MMRRLSFRYSGRLSPWAIFLVCAAFSIAGFSGAFDRAANADAENVKADDGEPKAADDGEPKAADDAAPKPLERPDRPLNPQRPVWIKLTGAIEAQKRMYFERRLAAAVARDADLVILEIDSPGGTLEDSVKMADHVIEITGGGNRDDKTPPPYIVAYIPREAISGAAILALSCNEILMGPNASIGDAGIIREEIRGDRIVIIEAEEKVHSYLAPKVRRYAEVRGRPPALAEAMVKHELKVYHVQNANNPDEKTYMSSEELEDAGPGQWKKLDPNPIFAARWGHYLTVSSGKEAIKLHLAEADPKNAGEVKEIYKITQKIEYLQEENWVDTLVYYLNQPWIVGLLFVVGLVALYIELNAPGVGAGATVAMLCFAVYFWSHWAAGTAGVLEIVLFVLGVGFILLEVFVIPGFGLPGILGAMMVLASIVLASQSVMIPTAKDYGEYVTNLRDILATMVVSAAVFLLLVMFLQRRMKSGGHLFGRLILDPPELEPAAAAASSAENEQQPGSRASELLGQRGTAVTALRPAGKVQIGDRYVDVVAVEGEFIEAGQPVEVVEAHGNVIVVSASRSALSS